MRRRHFVRLFVGGVVAATPFLVNAQETIPTVGVLIDMKPSLGTPLMGETFVGYMKGLGWEDGRHYRALFMWTEGHADRIPGLVNELVAKMVTVIVVFGNTAIDAAQRATTTIPIVCMADDMIKSGLAATMARPGSNTTGVSILASELDVKRLELLNEALPGSKRIGVLADPTTTSTRPQLEKAAHELQLDLVVVSARDSQELDRGLKVLETANIAGVNV